jgi:hypothetical protein
MIWGWFRKSGLPRGVYRPNIFEGPHLVQRWSYHSCSEIIWPSVPVQLQQRFMIEIQQNNALAAALKKNPRLGHGQNRGFWGRFPSKKLDHPAKHWIQSLCAVKSWMIVQSPGGSRKTCWFTWFTYF